VCPAVLHKPVLRFYRAMLRRARYCYGKSYVRPESVRLSVTLRYRDRIGWKSSKIISRLVSQGCSLPADPNITGLLQREQSKILTQMGQMTHPAVELSVADIRWQIAAEWLYRLQIAQMSQWRAYRKPTSLFPVVRSMNPY